MSFRVINDELEFARLEKSWCELGLNHPFLNWNWLYRWWQHFHSGRKLTLVVAEDRVTQERENQAQGAPSLVVPMYRESNLVLGDSLHWLGSGRASSDYMSLMSGESVSRDSVRALAEWLVGGSPEDRFLREFQVGDEQDNQPPKWSWIDFEGVAESDVLIDGLCQDIESYGGTVMESTSIHTWRATLTSDFQEYVQSHVSNHHRRRLRKLHREWLATERSTLEVADSPRQVDRFLECLIQMQIARRRAIGDESCFDRDQFCLFIRDVCHDYFQQDHLRLCRVLVDGSCVAYGLGFEFDGVFYLYQSGIEQKAMQHSPGILLIVHLIEWATQRGLSHVDFLRGDERYKAEVGAKPIGCRHIRIFAPSKSSIVRKQILQTGGSIRRFARQLKRP